MAGKSSRGVRSKPASFPVKQKPTNVTKSADSALDIPKVLRRLADNDRAVREQALAAVSAFVSSNKTFTDEQLQKLWKGLYYAMWHSDKPLVQQKLASELAGLVPKLRSKNFWRFVDAFWAIMIREWHSIDQYRVNKFYLLVRLFLRAILQRMMDEAWEDALEPYRASIAGSVMEPENARIPHALRLHFADIYVDELEKVFGDADTDDLPIAQLLQPVLDFVSTTEFKMCATAAKENILADRRLIDWNYVSVYTPKTIDKPKGADGDSESDLHIAGSGDSDWEGFE